MPASPSFPSSDGRGKWKRRKREPQISRRIKHEDSDDDNDDDELDREASEDHPNNPAAGYPSHSSLSFPDPVEVLADGGVRISDFPPVTRHAVNRPHASVMAIVAAERANLCGDGTSRGGVLPSLENLSCGQMAALSAVPSGEGDQDRNDGGNSFVVTPPHIMEGRGVVKRFGNKVLLVPMHSDWFAPATVHRLERQVAPHFFSGKSTDHTPEKYMDCRNHIVAKYMENPDKRVAVSDCQGLVPGIGDEELSRIVRFLDHWGIINYCAAAPSRKSWNSSSYLRDDVNGEVQVPSAALKSIDSLIKFDKPKCGLKADEVYSSISCHDNLSDLDNRIRERLSENCCNYCGRPLLNLYYQSQKDVDILLCGECFHDGRFVIGHSSLDFVKLDSTKNYGDGDAESWTDQETFRLLEAMELYNENWNEIAEHVNSKSKAQCILHFLRLPMEDGRLENIEVPMVPNSTIVSNGDAASGVHSSSNGSCSQDKDLEIRLPFENSENPVMSLVAFLASSVGPRVAAACAHASLAALSEDSRYSSLQLEGGQGNAHGEAANSVHQNEKVKAAARTGLAAAATKGKLFADHEEREIQRLSAIIINHQLKRLELKLKQFAEVETLLMRECEQVEKMRQRFAAERARIQSINMVSAMPTSQITQTGVDPSMSASSSINNRPQMMHTPSPQPSISGYGNSQQIHPHMQFMQQRGLSPSMFPMGPRLPLSAIQPSSSGQSSVMFNSSGN
ncbi:SWI/SNF complex subunit SWI3C [Linum grandiflorum]